MPENPDILIIGGGVIGCAAAYELARAGRSVTLLERGELAGESSSAAAGLLVPLHASEGDRPTPRFNFYLESARCFPQLVPELESTTGIQLQYDPAGSLRIAVGNEQAERLRAEFKTWQALGALTVEWLSREDLLRLEPALTPEVSAGVLSHDEKSLNPGRYTQALARAAAACGATIRTHCPVTGVRHNNGRFEAVRTPDGEVPAADLLIAAGAWAGLVCRWFNLEIPIAPARGQMVSVRPVSRIPTRAMFSYNGSVLPRLNGAVYVGSTVENAGFNRSNTPEGIAAILAMIPRLVPALNTAPIERIWAGLRPRSADETPVIGRLPGFENITLAGGHFKMGITGSALTARAVKDLLVHGKTDPLIAPFSPQRFL